MMKTLLLVIASFGGIVLIIESSLKLFLGLGNPPIYIADEQIGYLLAPNQNLHRKGNQIKINQYSMRSQEITEKKSTDSTRIFLLGDSIVNGNWWTDQKNILSELIKQELNSHDVHNLEALNASANSWNPRSELAYIQKFGLFEADILVLVINTDDLFGLAPNPAIVGRHPQYPQQKPYLALIELYQRYLQKPKPIPEVNKRQSKTEDRVGVNLAAINQLRAIAEANNTRFILVFTPLLRELQEGSRDYEQKARHRVQELVTQQQITYLDFLPLFQDFPQPEFLYRDHIHLSPQGEKMVSQTISEAILSLLKETNN